MCVCLHGVSESLSLTRWNPSWLYTICVVLSLLVIAQGHEDTTLQSFWRGQVTFYTEDGQSVRTELKKVIGVYGANSAKRKEYALLHHVNSSLDTNKSPHGCDDEFYGVPENMPWIALIRRGGCSYTQKIRNAIKHKAEAVVIYNKNGSDVAQNEVYVMSHSDFGVSAILIRHNTGDFISQYMEEHSQPVYVQISPGTEETPSPLPPLSTGPPAQEAPSKPVLVVSIVFICLMLFALGWLVLYYVQRHRVSAAKDHKVRQLIEAVKKATKRLPLRKLRDDEMSTECTVCQEAFTPQNNIIRIIPCKHIFHRMCLENWLQNPTSTHRCPNCNADVLEGTGVALPRIGLSSRRPDPELGEGSSADLTSSSSGLQMGDRGDERGACCANTDSASMGSDESQDLDGRMSDEFQSLVGRHHHTSGSSSGPAAIFSSRHRHASGSSKIFLSTGSQI